MAVGVVASYELPDELCHKLIAYLEMLARGGMPNPDTAMELLRGLRLAMYQSRPGRPGLQGNV